MEPRSGNSFEQPSAPQERSQEHHELDAPAVERVEIKTSPTERSPMERESTAAAAVQLATPPVVLPSPVAADDMASATNVDDDLPSVAADDDLIEKEWVDKAKKIIAETKDDPYRREREIHRLQVDYLKKRYGKELGGEQ